MVSPCNKEAFEFVKNYDSSNETLPKNFAISAPKLAGKSYLANIWCKKVGAEFLNLADLKNINLIKKEISDRYFRNSVFNTVCGIFVISAFSRRQSMREKKPLSVVIRRNYLMSISLLFIYIHIWWWRQYPRSISSSTTRRSPRICY